MRDCGIAVRFARWREMVWFCGPLLLSGLAAFALGRLRPFRALRNDPFARRALFRSPALRPAALAAMLMRAAGAPG